MLERFALAAAHDEFAQGIGFSAGESARSKFRYNFMRGILQQMREEQFRLQARRFDAFFGEKFGAFLNRFEDGHALKSKLIFRAEKLIFDLKLVKTAN